MDMSDQNQHNKAEITQCYVLYPTLTDLQPEDRMDTAENQWRNCFALVEQLRIHRGMRDPEDQKYLNMLYEELKYLHEHSGCGENQGLLSAESVEREGSPQKLNARSTADIMYDYEKSAAYVQSPSNYNETPMDEPNLPDGTVAEKMISRSTDDILECYT